MPDKKPVKPVVKPNTLPPLTITDPAEFKYRQKMYSDSLSLYNQTEVLNKKTYDFVKKYNYEKHVGNKDGYGYDIVPGTLKFEKHSSKKGVEGQYSGIVDHGSGKFIGKNPAKPENYTKVTPKFKEWTTETTDWGFGVETEKLIARPNTGFTQYYANYKKPVQPVVLKETKETKETSVNKKPIQIAQDKTLKITPIVKEEITPLPMMEIPRFAQPEMELAPTIKFQITPEKPQSNRYGVLAGDEKLNLPEDFTQHDIEVARRKHASDEFIRKNIEYRNKQLSVQTFKEGGPLMKQFALGGPMDQQSDQNAGQLTQFNAGGSHQENPQGGISQGMNPNGQQNMVEQGETKLNAKNYIYSDTLKVDKNTVKDFYFPTKYVGKTFAEVSKLMERPDSKRKYDSIEEASKKRDLEALMSAQETLKQKSLEKDMNEMMIKHPEFMSSMMAQQPQGQPMVDPNSAPIENPQGGEQLPPQSPMAKMGGFQNHYSLGGNIMDLGKNYVTGLADASLGAVGMDNVIKDSDYSGMGSDFAKKSVEGSNFIHNKVAPAIANVLLPGSGAVISGAQQAGGQVNPEDNTGIPNLNPAVIQQSLDSNGRPINTMALGGGLGNPPYDESSYGMNTEDYVNYLNSSNQQTVPQTTPPPYNTLYPKNNLVDYSGSEDGSIPLGVRSSGAQNIYPPASTSNESFGILQSDGSEPSQNNEQNYDPLTENIMKSSNITTNQYPSHSGTLGDQGGIGTNETKQTALNAAGTYAPAAYNIGMGLFGKVGKLNADDYINNTKLANWRNNINPQLKATDEAFASGHAGLRGSGAGGGAYLASMQALANQQGMQKAGIHANAENDYNSRQLQIDQMNAAKGDQAAQMRLQIAQYNAQAKAAKTKTLQEGLSQVGQIAQSDTQNKLAASANKMYSPTYGSDQGPYTGYIKYLENLAEQNKNAKTN